MNNNNEYLVCPICGKHVGNLISHLRRSHNNKYKCRNDVEKDFPELTGKPMQISKQQIGDFVCPYCGKIYKKRNALQLHIKREHPDKYVKLSVLKEYLVCPICGKHVGNMKQHIRETHELVWGDFCKTYNWDIKLCKIITDEYRKKLSDNKKIYYASEIGLKRKEKQSKFWKENNPVYDKKCLEKSMYNRSRRGNCASRINDSVGIKVKYDGYTFRSFNEFEFYCICKNEKLDIRYEPKEYTVKWFNSKSKFYTSYLPDFYIDGLGIIELKDTKYHCKSAYQQEKYIKVKNVYNKLNIPFEIHCQDSFYKKAGIENDFKLRDYIKKLVLSESENDNIEIISPYQEPTKLINIFGMCLSKVKCLKFTKIYNRGDGRP